MSTEMRTALQAEVSAKDAVSSLIDGSWAKGSGPVKEVRNPANGEVVSTVPFSSAGQIDAAVAAAKQAQREWAKVSVADQAKILQLAVEGLEAGVVNVNNVDNAGTFGGWKKSGIGRERGEDALREFANVKNLSFNVA